MRTQVYINLFLLRGTPLGTAQNKSGEEKQDQVLLIAFVTGNLI